MSKIIIMLLLVLIGTNCTPQPNPERLIEHFLVDLKENRLNNEELINKYFEFKDAKSPADIKEFALPFLSEHFNLIRQKLMNDCSVQSVQKYDLVNASSYKLNYEKKENVYFILCDDEIVTPVLIVNNKILSVAVYSKTQEGTKTFVIY